MSSRSTREATAKYYSRIGSRLGYLLVMKRSQHFGYYAHAGDTEAAAQTNYHKQFAKLLELDHGGAVLDAGCGQGVVACYLASNFDIRVTGITIVPSEVKNATRLARQMGLSATTNFLLADYAEPPFADNSFDRVYTTETLSHAPSVKQVLGELVRVLKPGGLAVFAEYEFDIKHFNEQSRRAAEFVKNHAAIHGIYQFEPGMFPAYLEELGLIEITEQDWTPHLIPSFNRLRHLAKPAAKIVKTLKLERHFVNSVAAAMYADGVDNGVFKYKVYSARKQR